MINKEDFEKHSVKENLGFVKKVLRLATHNAFTKDDLLLLIKWQNTIIEKAKITLKILENTNDTVEEVFCLEKLKELLGDTND